METIVVIRKNQSGFFSLLSPIVNLWFWRFSYMLGDRPFFPLTARNLFFYLLKNPTHVYHVHFKLGGQSKHFDIAEHWAVSTHSNLRTYSHMEGESEIENEKHALTNHPLIAFLWTRCPHSVRLLHMQSIHHTTTTATTTTAAAIEPALHSQWFRHLACHQVWCSTNEISVGKCRK